MIYARIILNDNIKIEENLAKLKAVKKSYFAFYDLIYLNKNGASITEDTLKIRVYQKNNWDNSNVLMIRKTAPLVNGVKEDKVILREEFQTVDEAKEYVDKNLSDEFEYKIKLEKTGIEYGNDNLRIWVENIKDIGWSIEFGAQEENDIEDAIKLFDVKERLNISVPEYLYNKLRNFKISE